MMRVWVVRCVGLMIAALALVGCGAVAQFQRQCPAYDSISAPTWSSDGTRLAYIIGDAPTKQRVYVTNLSANNTTLLTDAPAKFITPQWSPDGTLLLSAYETDYWEYQLIIIEQDGTQTEVSEPLSGYPELQWSPNGEYIAVLNYLPSDSESQWDTLVFDITGELQWRLQDNFPEPINLSYFDWSPDGTQLAFAYSGLATDQAGETILEHYIAIIDSSGENLTAFPVGEPFVGAVQWSPDGSQIAFLSLQDDIETALNVINPDGSSLKTLVAGVRRSYAWLPDSSGLIYHAENEIYQVSSDGSSEPAFVMASPSEDTIVFSPDASKLAYFKLGKNQSGDLFVMNIDGTDVQQITHNPGNSMCFHWPF